MVQVVRETGEWEVVQVHRPSVNYQHLLEINGVETFKHRPRSEYPIRVVVAENEMYMTVQYARGQHAVPLLDVTETEVAEMVHVVIRSNYGVPVVNQSLVHFFNRFPGSVAIFDDVRVPKMS